MSRNKVIDPFGKEYESKTAMCEAYGVKLTTFKARRKEKWTIRESLGIDKRRKPIPLYNVLDPFGNRYTSDSAMCKDYGIAQSTFCLRKQSGWTLRECLGIDKRVISIPPNSLAIPSIDPFGKKYVSKSAMCKAYGVELSTFVNRKKSGWTFRECLGIDEHLDKRYSYDEPVCTVSPDGRLYSSEKAMSEGYGVDYADFLNRKSFGWSVEECLELCGRGLDAKIRKGNDINPLLRMERNRKDFETKNDDGRSYFRVRIISTNDLRYFNSDCIKAFAE